MTRLVLILAALLGWTAYTQLARHEKKRRLFGERPDAFPFPTGDGLRDIDLTDAKAVEEWCRTFGCIPEQLRTAVRHVGATPSAVRRHLRRRR